MLHTNRHTSAPSLNLSSATMARVGVVGALVAAALSNGCSSKNNPRQAEKPTPTTPEIIPVDPLVAESTLAFNAGQTMGKTHLVYCNSSGRHVSQHSQPRHFSLNKTDAADRGGFTHWDVSVSQEKGLPQFQMSNFEVWRSIQMEELLSRSDIKEILKTPGTGILFSVDGSAFQTFLQGDRIHMQQVEPVKPFLVLAAQR